MRILDYDDVDPVRVLHLTMLALNFPFTPEQAVHIRRTDPRHFPFLTLNAVQDEQVLGQVGVFRLPMISTEGRENVGGLWGVATHPQYLRRGVTSALLEEAHARMREAGLRFSVLGTGLSRLYYRLYERHGYVGMHIWATAMARWETAHQPTRLHARLSGSDGFDLVERIFSDLSGDYLGFAWRHTPSAPLRDKVKLDEVWTLWESNDPVGYIFARKENTMLMMSAQLLRKDINVVEAIAAVANEMKAAYVQVSMSRPSDIDRLRSAGWYIAHPNGDAFMVKPLVSSVTSEDARRLFSIGTDRFLISWLDTT